MNDYNKSTFPDPLATTEDKVQNAYGLAYAKALVVQWGGIDTEGSLYRRRFKDFETSRQYANGTQDTSIYKQILNSLDANNGDGTMMTLDWTPVPIIPKFAKIVVNKIISSYRYPQVEAIDPLSQNEKDIKKKKIALRIENKEMFQEAKNAGLNVDVDPEKLPQTPEEVEIFLDTNIKTDAEIAAQLATNLTLSWNNYDERVYRRTVEDLVNCGMAVTKRSNDPNYGIQEDYVDPAYFLHSYTDDPTFSDMVYAGHIKRISIMELKRLAGSQFTEEQYQKMAKTVMNRFGNNASRFVDQQYDQRSGSYNYGYDEYTLEILDFEFLSVDTMVYEKKQSRFGNIGFYYKGNSYEAPTSSVYDRDPVQMNNATVYGGIYITGTEYIFNYGQKNNVPKNIHDLTRARMSYSVVATNIRNMIPKSLVSGIIGFADQLQLSHLKIQQAIAKSKPDGIIIDIEGLENVDLGRGGDLQPLEIQDIYEQTGVFYYRSKNPEGGFQNAPVQQIDNRIRNINELIALYNHYLRMIRDATGINEVMDGTTPKGEALVGVNQMAVAAGNNALYDITNSAMIMYRKVCEDILKCLQILPEQSVLYNVYEKAIGKTNMKVLNSFKDLPMYNFGVQVMTDLNDRDRQYLEQNIQIALAQKEIDLEDAIAQTQAMQQANIQAQAQANAQASQASAQAEIQKEQAIAQIDMQKSQMEFEMKAQLAQLEHQMRLELETLRGEYGIAEQQIESNVKNTAEVMKEDRKDDRVKKQAVEQSKLISQRQGQRGELPEDSIDTLI